jgi:hypothetical protein
MPPQEPIQLKYPCQLDAGKVEIILGRVVFPIGWAIAIGAVVFIPNLAGYILGAGHAGLWTYVFMMSLRTVTLNKDDLSAKLILRTITIKRSEILSYKEAGIKNPRFVLKLSGKRSVTIPRYGQGEMEQWLAGVVKFG